MNSRAAIKAAVPLTFAIAVAILVIHGAGADGTRTALRVTARIALVLFLAAFVARPVFQLAPTSLTRWLVQNRSLIGVCFGLCLSIHVGLIIRLVLLARPGWPAGIGSADILIGIPGVVFVLAMLVSSHRRVRAAMNPAHWRLLHRTGLYLVWFIFFACLVSSMVEKAARHPRWEYVPFIVATAAAAIVRIWAMMKSGSLRPPAVITDP